MTHIWNDGFCRSVMRGRGSITMLMVLCLFFFPAQGWPADNVDNNIRVLASEKNNWFKRVQAAQELGKTGDKSAVNALIKAAQGDSNTTVRCACFKALGETGAQEAVTFLRDALGKEKDWVLRKGIIQALAQSGDPEAVTTIINTLEKDPNVFVRRDAALSLGELGDKRAIDPLKKALQDEGVVVHRNADNDTISVTRDVVVAAADSLKKLGIEVSKDTLEFDWVEWDIHQLETNKKEKSRATSAWRLGMSNSKKAVDPLIKALLEDPESDVRRNAASSLAHLGYKKAIDPLIQAMDKDKSFWVRASAGRALAGFGDKKSVKAINKALEEKKISAKNLGKDLKKIRK